MPLDAREQPRASSSATEDEARAFLQERLAYFGKILASIGIGFYLFGNLTAASLVGDFPRRLSNPAFWIVPAASATYAIQWVLCRRGAFSQSALRVIDATTTTIAAVVHSMMVFSSIPGELIGFSYTRALLLVSFGVLARAIMVPSSSLRTLLLGIPAVGASTVASHLWYAGQPSAQIPASVNDMLTGLWCLGAVIIATLASHVIYGLRQQVREAWQLGQYTLLEKIGEGGMGAVYRAKHAMLRRPTAVKLLPVEKAGADRLDRFEREVQLTSLLTHMNTVAVFDYGRTPDGVLYYAMEYLEGLNLEDLVRLDGPQPAGRVVHILRQVASSLAEAHGIGLIHRDIKPGNVILVAERGGAPDVAKVVDFGLVKELDQKVNVTREDQIAGTPHYLAPEMISSPGDVGPQSDLYSLGCLGYYLLTGQTVFEGRTVVEVCSHHLQSHPVPPGDRIGRFVPEALSAAVMRCLEKTPDQRPQTAQTLVEMLDSCLDVEPWTKDMGRAWWKLHGRTALAYVRQQRAVFEGEFRSAIPTTYVSFVRPAQARRRA